jgi:hypothetical protein
MMTAKEIRKGAMTLDENGRLTVFEKWGYLDCKTWVVKLTGDIGVAIDAFSASQHIENTFNRDIRNGSVDISKITHINVNPNGAILLYLEGRITRKDIEQAVADDKSVTFSNIKFSTKNGEVALSVIVKNS